MRHCQYFIINDCEIAQKLNRSLSMISRETRVKMPKNIHQIKHRMIINFLKPNVDT
jgi:hypothetical protein